MTDAALARTYIDTSIVLDAFEGDRSHSEELRRFFNALTERPKRAVTSELTIAELFGRESTKGWVWQRRFYFDLIVYNPAFDLRPVTRDILIETGEFRREARSRSYAVKLGDAIHAVTATKAECRFLFTCDKRLLVSPSMTRLLPDEHGFAILRQALDA